MRKLLIATTNAGKVRELRALLEALPVTLVGLSDLDPIPAPEETGATFMENAEAKALYYAHATGLWTLADDSGLEVDALDGAPGVHSARYAGPDADDRANNTKLIRALAGVGDERRAARFRCAVALAGDGAILARATGSIEGRIIDKSRGANGFGYDPHFHVEAFGLTSAEMAPELKNRVSHRGRALAALLPELARILRDEMT
jgi:XTP/dITP diphosphohydrolase